ncbi:MAG: hypothetical protein HY908_35640, partial [Myxococcales bacterium]|nr:hypothetical protein [Myxococcales bacterium]
MRLAVALRCAPLVAALVACNAIFGITAGKAGSAGGGGSAGGSAGAGGFGGGGAG